MKFIFWQDIKKKNTKWVYQQPLGAPEQPLNNPKNELLDKTQNELKALGDQALEGLKDKSPDEQYSFLLHSISEPAERLQKIAAKVDISVLNRLALEKAQIATTLFANRLNGFLPKLSHEAQASLMKQTPTEQRITQNISDEAVNICFEANSRVFLSNQDIYHLIPRLSIGNQNLVLKEVVGHGRDIKANIVENIQESILVRFVRDSREEALKLLSIPYGDGYRIDFLDNDVLERNISAMDMYDSSVKFLKKDNVTYVRTPGGYRAIISDKWDFGIALISQTQAEIGEKMAIVTGSTISTLTDPEEIANAEMALRKAQENPPARIKDESYNPSFFEMTKPENVKKAEEMEANRRINASTALDWKSYIDTTLLPSLEESKDISEELKLKIKGLVHTLKVDIDSDKNADKTLDNGDYIVSLGKIFQNYLATFSKTAEDSGLSKEKQSELFKNSARNLEDFVAHRKEIQSQLASQNAQEIIALFGDSLSVKQIETILQETDNLGAGVEWTEERFQEILSKAQAQNPENGPKLFKLLKQRLANNIDIAGTKGVETMIKHGKEREAFLNNPSINAMMEKSHWFREGFKECLDGPMSINLEKVKQWRARIVEKIASLEAEIAKGEKTKEDPEEYRIIIAEIDKITSKYSEIKKRHKDEEVSIAEDIRARSQFYKENILPLSETFSVPKEAPSAAASRAREFWGGVEKKAAIHRKNLELLAKNPDYKNLNPEQQESMRQAVLMGDALEMSSSQVSNFISIVNENKGNVPKNLDIVGVSKDGKNLIIADGNNQTFKFITSRNTLIHTSLANSPNPKQFEVPKNEIGSAQFTYKFFSGFMGIGKDQRAAVDNMRRIGGRTWPIMLEELLGQDARNNMTGKELDRSYHLGAQLKGLTPPKTPAEFFEALLGTKADGTVNQNEAGRKMKQGQFYKIWRASENLAPSQPLQDLFKE